MKKQSKKGLTPLEMSALTIIIILAATVVIPQFCSLSEEAKKAAEKQDVSRIRIAITDYYIDSMLKNRNPLCPETLDSANTGYASSDNQLFTKVLTNNVTTSGGWRKLGSMAYEGCSGTKYTYSSGTCSFDR
jgi:type II secretory pathway pseudopilin PulG